MKALLNGTYGCRCYIMGLPVCDARVFEQTIRFVFYAGLVKGFIGLIYEHYSIKDPLPAKLSLQAGKGFSINKLPAAHVCQTLQWLLMFPFYNRGIF